MALTREMSLHGPDTDSHYPLGTRTKDSPLRCLSIASTGEKIESVAANSRKKKTAGMSLGCPHIKLVATVTRDEER